MNANEVRSKDEQALWQATYECNVAEVRRLIGLGTNLAFSMGNGEAASPLHLAALKGYAEIVDDLLAAGADPNVRNTRGATPLHSVCGASVTSLNGARYDERVVRALVSAGADINAQDTMGATPLHDAVCSSDSRAFSLLLTFQPEIDRPDHDGKTPLFWAASMCRLQKIKDLLAAGATPDHMSIHGESPLLAAVSTVTSIPFLSEGAESVECLASSPGVNLLVKNRLGRSLLQICNKNKQIKDILRNCQRLQAAHQARVAIGKGLSSLSEEEPAVFPMAPRKTSDLVL